MDSGAWIMRTRRAAVLRPYTHEVALQIEVAGPLGGGDFAAYGHALEFDPGDD